MKLKTFQFNPVEENTYIIYDDTKECVIVDAGCYFPDEKEELLHFILDNDLVVKHLINTHLHFDHVFGSEFVREQFGQLVKAHKDDEYLLKDFAQQLVMFGFKDTGDRPQIGTYLNQNDIIEFGNQQLKVIHVPGHSPGSVVFYDANNQSLFVGDVLFRGSVGRTDLPKGDHNLLINGIKTKLLTLPADTIIYSGHGPTSTIRQEISSNPFLR